jgi:metal-responsive CopG/Arc/MetJ family transcriptional regulator
MKRIHHYMSEKQIAELEKISEERDLSISEIIRRAIDDYLEKQKKKEK